MGAAIGNDEETFFVFVSSILSGSRMFLVFSSVVTFVCLNRYDEVIIEFDACSGSRAIEVEGGEDSEDKRSN